MDLPSTDTHRAAAPHAPSTAEVWAGRVFMIVWIPLLVAVIGTLMVGHWAPLPKPAVADERLDAALGAIEPVEVDAPAASGDGLTAFHVLYADCRCSRRVVAHLLESERPQDLDEVVLLVGEDEDLAEACREAGFAVHAFSQEELRARFGVESAPLFVVTDAGGTSRYVGGYTDRKQGLDHRDLEFVERIRAGEEVVSLPVYGCGVSASLQESLDPLGVKY